MIFCLANVLCLSRPYKESRLFKPTVDVDNSVFDDYYGTM